MKEKIYFPGLNGLRFLAAIAVIVVHIEQFKQLFGLTDGTTQSQFFLAPLLPTGIESVILFYVLSGFLITYLLLSESQKTGQIAVRRFYLRRILRIWPLYYLRVFVGFVVIPAI
jgi:peptidoglycan/LPS O-acetylase OafA/YrhL